MNYTQINFEIGDKVEHKKFGSGEIVEIGASRSFFEVYFNAAKLFSAYHTVPSENKFLLNRQNNVNSETTFR